MSRVVLIEDDEGIAELLAFNLEAAGHTVLAARDGVSGLHLARTSEPDVVLLDVMLPGMDGIEVCRRLRRSSSTPVIMLTAHEGSALDAVRGSSAGADGYVAKPFSIGELLSCMASVQRRELAPQQPAESGAASGRGRL